MDTTRGTATSTLVALSLVATVAATAVAVDLLSRFRPLADRIQARDLARFVRGEEFFPNRGNFIEFEDRLLVDEIPNADYSHGGVYFFGASDLKWALATWELPAEEQPFVGNYGVGALSHVFELQFLRFLIEDEHLLEAGGDKTRIILGVSWSNAVSWAPEAYFGPLWRRHGLYTYTADGGIHQASQSRFGRWLRTERAHCSGFIGGGFNRLARGLMTGLGLPLEAADAIKDPAEISAWVRTHTHLPEASVEKQVRAFDDLLAYLQAQGVGVTVVFLPHRRAFDELPLVGVYHDEVTRICRARSVETVDLTHALSEDEFWDMGHPNYRGLQKTNAALMQVAAPHLARIAPRP
ncbi:MAG TPA: hypothetical protein VFC25_14470 [Verrucomicrobiae bacterium]|nr:hypothetical protein [Verrucomicrobiae bacterium]